MCLRRKIIYAFYLITTKRFQHKSLQIILGSSMYKYLQVLQKCIVKILQCKISFTEFQNTKVLLTNLIYWRKSNICMTISNICTSSQLSPLLPKLSMQFNTLTRGLDTFIFLAGKINVSQPNFMTEKTLVALEVYDFL